MFTDELRNLILKVITSWQVIVVTAAILLYVAIVNYASRAYYRRRTPPVERPLKIKNEKEAPQEEVDDSGLGLED